MASTKATESYLNTDSTWSSFNLDPRLIQAIDHVGFSNPTYVQSSAIPLALEEKRDIIAKASTGSGKTAAYCIPILNNLFTSETEEKSIKSVILVPTRELSSQVTKFLEQLLLFNSDKVSVLNLSSNISEQVLNSLLINKPDIVISTPAKLLQFLEKNVNSNLINLSKVQSLTIDEVDLVISYGYSDDLQKLGAYLPAKKNLQTYLMSATINDEVNELKSRFCTKPAILKLDDDEATQNNLVQYYAKTTEFDKFLLAYVIFKLNLIKGKTIIFVNNIDRGYRLKLFLEQFGIRSCILNSELPVNSRIHIVEEFNKNIYKLLIATDENSNNRSEMDVDSDQEQDNVQENDRKSTKGDKQNNGKEYGVSRGVDFKNVACVLNFDLPTSSKAYIHRIGRTARAGKSGMALSFVIPLKEVGKHKTACLKTAKKDEKILRRIVKQQSRSGFDIKPYQFDMKQVEGFRYRAEDAFRAVTLVSIKEARYKELKEEILTSDKLKRFFEENPQDLSALRHDKELHPAKVQAHLKRVPEYLLPESARNAPSKIGFVPFHKTKGKPRKRKASSKKVDPLKSLRT